MARCSVTYPQLDTQTKQAALSQCFLPSHTKTCRHIPGSTSASTPRTSACKSYRSDLPSGYYIVEIVPGYGSRSGWQLEICYTVLVSRSWSNGCFFSPHILKFSFILYSFETLTMPSLILQLYTSNVKTTTFVFSCWVVPKTVFVCVSSANYR